MINYSYETRGPLFSKDLNIEKLLDKALDATADWSQNRIRRSSPIDTGRLKAGWLVTSTSKGVRIDNPVPYTVYQERKVGMVQQNIPAIKDNLASNISKYISKIK